MLTDRSVKTSSALTIATSSRPARYNAMARSRIHAHHENFSDLVAPYRPFQIDLTSTSMLSVIVLCPCAMNNMPGTWSPIPCCLEVAGSRPKLLVFNLDMKQ